MNAHCLGLLNRHAVCFPLFPSLCGTFVARRTLSASTLRCSADSCTTTDSMSASAAAAAQSLAADFNRPPSPSLLPPPLGTLASPSPPDAWPAAAAGAQTRSKKRALYSETSSAFGVSRTMAGGGRKMLLSVFPSASKPSHVAPSSPAAVADGDALPPKRTNVYHKGSALIARKGERAGVRTGKTSAIFL